MKAIQKSIETNTNFTKIYTFVFVCFSFVCQHLLVISHINMCIFSQMLTYKTSKISSQCPYTPHHTVLPPDHFLATLISCPWSGLNPTGASQIRTIGTIPFVVPVPVTPRQVPPWCQVWPYRADWCHHCTGARPHPSRCQALATPTKAGYHSDTIINGRSLRWVGYHTQSN